jgi:hypothetical protein
MTDEKPPVRRRGYLNQRALAAFAFWTTAVCILVAVVACLLAIWEFTGTDVLWRTVATCVVIGAGTLTLTLVNGLFGNGERD